MSGNKGQGQGFASLTVDRVWGCKGVLSGQVVAGGSGSYVSRETVGGGGG